MGKIMNWFKASGLNKFDAVSIGFGAAALLFGLGSAIGSHKGNQVRANQINNMLDPRITQIPNSNQPIKK